MEKEEKEKKKESIVIDRDESRTIQVGNIECEKPSQSGFVSKYLVTDRVQEIDSRMAPTNVEGRRKKTD